MVLDRIAALEARLARLESVTGIAALIQEHDKLMAEQKVKADEAAKEAAAKQKAEGIALARKAAEARGPEALKQFDEEQAACEKAEAEKAEAAKQARQAAADAAMAHAKAAQEAVDKVA